MYETNNVKYISIVETMEKYQVCRATIYNLIKKGKLTQFKLKNQTYFKYAEIEKVFEIREVM